MSLEAIKTDQAPQAIGPYSQGIKTGGFLFLSGQIPLDPSSGEMVDGEIEPQTERVMENLKAVLESAGSSFNRVIKSTVFFDGSISLYSV